VPDSELARAIAIPTAEVTKVIFLVLQMWPINGIYCNNDPKQCFALQSLFAYVPFTWRACSTSEWPLEPQDRDLSRSRTEIGCYFCGALLP